MLRELTVKEILTTYAHLRLPKASSKEHIAAVIKDVTEVTSYVYKQLHTLKIK